MTANDTLIRVLDGMNADKPEVAYVAIEEYAETLSKNGNTYYKLKSMVKKRPMRFKSLEELPQNIKNLVRHNTEKVNNVFIGDDVKKLLNDLKLEWDNADSFRYHNIGIRNRILLHGVTGNGKTTIARHIASIVNLPFVEVNTDALIDSHMGSTGTNIYNMFNQIKEPCILFLDEADTIGKKRSSGSSAGVDNETDRIVNSLLVNLEKMGDRVIFIAATNRIDILDSAFLRRFDIKFELLPPTNEQKIEFSNTMANYYNVPNMLDTNTVENYDSYSEIKNAFITFARKFILNKLLSL